MRVSSVEFGHKMHCNIQKQKHEDDWKGTMGELSGMSENKHPAVPLTSAPYSHVRPTALDKVRYATVPIIHPN